MQIFNHQPIKTQGITKWADGCDHNFSFKIYKSPKIKNILPIFVRETEKSNGHWTFELNVPLKCDAILIW